MDLERAIEIAVQAHKGASDKGGSPYTYNKHLNIGDYLIDDRTKNGAGEFTGEHIHFGTGKFPDWKSVLDYLG